MKKNSVRIIGLIMICVCCFSLCGCSLYDRYLTIKNGFTPELVEMLEDEFKLAIPDDAEFIEGKYDPDWARDREVKIIFKVPEDELESMFIDDAWEESKGFHGARTRFKEAAGLLVGGKLSVVKSYTFVYYERPDEYGKIKCYAVLYRPSKTIT